MIGKKKGLKAFLCLGIWRNEVVGREEERWVVWSDAAKNSNYKPRKSETIANLLSIVASAMHLNHPQTTKKRLLCVSVVVVPLCSRSKTNSEQPPLRASQQPFKRAKQPKCPGDANNSPKPPTN
ncbi:hypothetical protein VTJ04DRAFT_3308 [Mycothermus thermophilus]|uniref:uncharacterized protein n=1 Tax=Humicola insolens TaxID=85995 RepID=UPI0037429D98